jgi:hypothetical protein
MDGIYRRITDSIIFNIFSLKQTKTKNIRLYDMDIVLLEEKNCFVSNYTLYVLGIFYKNFARLM